MTYSYNKFSFVVLQKPLAVGKDSDIEYFINKCNASILNKKLIKITKNLIAEHYKQFSHKIYFSKMVDYYNDNILHIWLVEGNDIIQANMRKLIGPPKPLDINSFRYFLVGESYKNLLDNNNILDNGIHVSSSIEEGIREGNIWF